MSVTFLTNEDKKELNKDIENVSECVKAERNYIDKIVVNSTNILDERTIQWGTEILSYNGKTGTNANYGATDFLLVPAGKTIFGSGYSLDYGYRRSEYYVREYAVYDKNKNYVSGNDKFTSVYTNNTTEDQYIRYNLYNNGRWADFMFELGDTEDDVAINDYKPYGFYLTDDVSDKRKIAELEAKIKAEIEDMQSRVITPKEYFVDEINDTVAKILSHSNSPCLIMPIITDTHYKLSDETNTRRTKQTFDNLYTVCKKVSVHGITHLGDINYPDISTITQEISDDTINYIRARMLEANERVYMVNGNHDGIRGSIPYTQNYNCMGTHNDSYVVREGDNPYFYVDYPKLKVRCFFLSTNTVELNYGIGTNQLNWFLTSLADMDKSYSIMLFSHIGTHSVDFGTNKETIQTVLNNFHAHTGDYSENTGICIAWFCGHEHFDWIVPTSESGLNFPSIVTTCSFKSLINPSSEQIEMGAVAQTRTNDTYTEDAWDIMIYRPSDNKINMIRFGAGDDREIDLSSWNTESN